MVANSGKLSTMSTAASNGLTDKVDSPHSGLFKGLHMMAQSNYALRDATTLGFAHTFTASGSEIQVAVTTGTAFYNGKYLATGDIAELDATTLPKPSTGAYYYWVVINNDDDGTWSIGVFDTASPAGDGIVPELTANSSVGPHAKIPISLIKVQSDDTHSTIAFQYFTTSKIEHSLSIGYDSDGTSDAGVYAPALSIESDADGDIDITSLVSDKDIIFNVNDGGASKEMLRLDADEPTIKIEQGSLKIKETAAAIADTPAYGQLWVKSDTPTSLYFTTDAGNDIKLSEEVIIVSLSDEATDLTVGDGKAYFNMPFAMTLTGVKATVNTAPTSANIIVDIEEAGSTVLTTLLSIDAGDKTSVGATSAAVIGGAGPALANDAEIKFNIDQIGSSAAGKGLKVTLYGYRT